MKDDKKSSPNPRLREARLDRGWSQQDLADLVGTTPVNISRWENGSNFPSPYFRQRLSEILGKTPAELGLMSLSHDSRIANIPITRSPFFTGRERLLALLHERLSTERRAALTQPQALYGLGGIGKTQTAVEYAFRYGDDYTHVFWVQASTHETLVADFATLAQLLVLSERDEQNKPRMLAAVKRWLAVHENWLLILDDADDLRLMQEFLPPTHKGYILFTTRAQAAGAFAVGLEVEKLSVQEGCLLLLRWSKLLNGNIPLEQARDMDRVDAERIVREMDGLPLAIVQAGSYVEETGCSLGDYLHLYATHRKDLLARRSNLLLHYPETVATTWSLSFRRIEQQDSAAADVLRFCAFLAPDAIPEELLTRGAAELGTALSPLPGDPFRLNEVFGILRRYSLLRRDGNTHMLSIHRLVQAVLRESMDQEVQRAWAEQVVRAVNAIFPRLDYGPGAKQQSYLSHVQECAALIEQYQLYFPQATELLYKAGEFLYFHGFYPQSQSLHRQALAIREQVLGAEHPSVAESFNALAVLARLLGDNESAEKFHHRAFSIREKVLGLEHLATAESLNNLGVLYRSQGKHEQSRQLLQQALSIRERLLGSEHPDTLATTLNLANLYAEQGKYRQAEALLEQTLATSERVLEPGHPLIAHTLNLLARLYYQQGNYEQAGLLWNRSLTILEKTLGPEHPATVGRLDDLAELYLAQRRYTQAQVYCQKALNICEKTLGAEHPDTIAYREHLSRIVHRNKGEQDANEHPVPPPR